MSNVENDNYVSIEASELPRRIVNEENTVYIVGEFDGQVCITGNAVIKTGPEQDVVTVETEVGQLVLNLYDQVLLAIE